MNALACLLLVFALRCATTQESDSAAPIPAGELAALEQQLEQAALGKSAVEVRMACKRVARQASALLEASPEAPNRYAVLAVLFRSQKRLLRLDATERNRNALFETASKLPEAPDEYAELRLEADLLLSERELSAANATVKERAKALEELLARYRGTPAEWKSLMFGSMISAKLTDFDLEQEIGDTIALPRACVDQVCVPLDRAGEDAHVVHAAHETIDDGLEDLCGDRPVGIVGELDGLAIGGCADGMFVGRRHIAHQCL